MTTKSNRNRLLAGALSLLLLGCSQSVSEDSQEPDWDALPDGSRLLVSEYGDTKVFERCFPSESEFECLRAVQATPGMIHLLWDTVADLEQEDTTSTSADELTGYRCAIYPDAPSGAFIRESIASKHGEIRVKTVQVPRSFNETPFSKQEVESYFEANSIVPNDPWLNCYRVAQLVVEGSFASLTSSDLTLETFTSD